MNPLLSVNKFLKAAVLILTMSCLQAEAQVRIVDAQTKKAIPFVHIISKQGVFIGLSDANGVFNYKNKNTKIKIQDKDTVVLSHISYKNKNMRFQDFINSNSVKMTENVFIINNVEITARKPPFLVLKGYFRSYQLDDHVPQVYMDGIVEYYISKSRRLKAKILECRTYRNRIIYDELLLNNESIAGVMFFALGDQTGPPYIEKNTLLKKFPENYQIDTSNNEIVKIDSTTTLLYKSKKITVNKIYTTPETTYSRSLLGCTVQFVNDLVTEVYAANHSNWNRKSNLLKLFEHRKQFVSHKKSKHPPVQIESAHEFHVYEHQYISKDEYKKKGAHSFFGSSKTIYKTDYWKELKERGIDEPPGFIKDQFGKTLILYK